MSDEKKMPVETLRESNLSAKIWENQHEHGTSYNTTISRRYQDREGQWHQTNSFGDKDLLPLANIATRANDAVRELKEQNRVQERQAEQQAQAETRTRNRDRDRGR